MAYDRGGLKALERKPIGGRKRENMSLDEERALLARFAKAAGAGEMLNIHDLKAAYEKAIGHETSTSTVYYLLARHGWRKLMPRPFHPKRDIRAQDAFKKMAFPTPFGKPSVLPPRAVVNCGSCSPMKRVLAG
jgi:transposase